MTVAEAEVIQLLKQILAASKREPKASDLCICERCTKTRTTYEEDLAKAKMMVQIDKFHKGDSSR